MTKIISGTSNVDLSRRIGACLDISLTECKIERFSDQEIAVEICEEICAHDVFIIQSTCFPANDNLMELLLIADAAKRAGAKTINLVVPYFGYGRQDRRASKNKLIISDKVASDKMAAANVNKAKSPISAKLVAKIIAVAGVERVITIELHSEQIEGFFDIHVADLSAMNLFVQDIKYKYSDIGFNNLVIVSPDAGRVNITKRIADLLGIEMIIVTKIRARANESAVVNIFGQYKDKNCIIIDDIVDSAGTLCNTANALSDGGARSVSAYITHPVFSDRAIERINESLLNSLIVTDTIPYKRDNHKIEVLSTAELIAQHIKYYVCC